MSIQSIEFQIPGDQRQGSGLLFVDAAAGCQVVAGAGTWSQHEYAARESANDRRTPGGKAGIATFRYNFPYSESGGGRNSNAVCMATIRAAVAAARQSAKGLDILAGGHSFSGRMTSMAMAEQPIPDVRGLVFFAFPLHPAGKPGTDRAKHLNDVNVPMLFLSGTRDKAGRTRIGSNPFAISWVKTRRCTCWTPPTMASKLSKGPGNPQRTSMSKWLAPSPRGQSRPEQRRWRLESTALRTATFH